MPFSCDTLIAFSAEHGLLFGKNSDRHPNEAAHCLHTAAADYTSSSSPPPPLRCTYSNIPQAPRTYACFLAKPHQVWGAEMGVNEHGLCIGNEALFARVPPERGDGRLTGLDLVRLALERTRTAREALDCITGLLAQHGQGGDCGYQEEHMYYHNGFMLADAAGDCWQLETVNREWVARHWTDGVHTLSNGLSIGTKFELASARVVSDAVERGWCADRASFHFARIYAGWDRHPMRTVDGKLTTYFAAGDARRCRTRDLLLEEESCGPLTVMRVLRDHGLRRCAVGDGWLGQDVCMHAGPGVRLSQTTNSFVASVQARRYWVTGTAAPCMSLFKPVRVLSTVHKGAEPTAKFDPLCVWWKGEALHRAVLGDYEKRLALFAEERDAMEERWVRNKEVDERRAWDEADAATTRWVSAVTAVAAGRVLGIGYAWKWAGWDAVAAMPPALHVGAGAKGQPAMWWVLGAIFAIVWGRLALAAVVLGWLVWREAGCRRRQVMVAVLPRIIFS